MVGLSGACALWRAIELLQKYFFASRSAEWGDWIADIFGSLTAVILIIIFFRKRRYNRKIYLCKELTFRITKIQNDEIRRFKDSR